MEMLAAGFKPDSSFCRFVMRLRKICFFTWMPFKYGGVKLIKEIAIGMLVRLKRREFSWPSAKLTELTNERVNDLFGIDPEIVKQTAMGSSLS